MPVPLRSALYVLPVATVAVVALALVTGGAARPFRVARVWGGPTSEERVDVRVEVLDVLEERGAVHEAPVSAGTVSVQLSAPGFDAVRTALLDAEGGAEVAFEPPKTARPLAILVTQAGAELARGGISLAAAPWARAARRRGGFAEAQAGDFVVRVAPARGALAVPFQEQLLVEVSRAGAPAANVRVHASGTGARLTPSELRTAVEGRATFAIAPDEHAVTVVLDLGEPGASVQASFALPIVPGALRARREGQTLVIESPVPREVAYFALVTESERLFGGRVTLKADARGETTARVSIPDVAKAAQYAVVASERDLRSSAAVGWPLASATDGEPALTFDAVEALLVDGRPRAMLRDAGRRSRVRWVVGAFCAASLAIELLMLIAFTRKSDRALDAHLEGAGVNAEEATRLAPKRSPAVIVALIAVALGFLVITLIGVLRIE